VGPGIKKAGPWSEGGGERRFGFFGFFSRGPFQFDCKVPKRWQGRPSLGEFLCGTFGTVGRVVGAEMDFRALLEANRGIEWDLCGN